MENKDNQEKKKLEEITVILSPVEETLVKIPLFGEAYSSILQRKYERLFKEYEKIVLR
jgi:hypothetical protein